MRKPACWAALPSVCVLAAAPASAATLVHAYDFANTGAAPVSFDGSCNTVIGNQFCRTFNEYFTGRIDTVKIYAGVATYAEATASGAVHEPSAWALMILGFGGAGTMLRRRGRGGGLALAPALRSNTASPRPAH